MTYQILPNTENVLTPVKITVARRFLEKTLQVIHKIKFCQILLCLKLQAVLATYVPLLFTVFSSDLMLRFYVRTNLTRVKTC